MSLGELTFGVPDPGNSPKDEPGDVENGDVTLTSPELILVAGDEEAQRARDALTEVVPTDERILAEVKARSLRVAASAVVPPAAPPAPLAPEGPPPPAPVEVAPPAPAPPPARRRPRLLAIAALVPIAALGLALGVRWNPFSGSDDAPSTAAAPRGQIGTATSAPGAITSNAPAPSATSTGPSGSTPAPTRARTTAPTPASTHAGAGSPTTGAGAPRTSTTKHATTKHTTTTRPPRSGTTSKPPAKPRTTPPTITPSHVFAWPAAPNASFYLVSFMRDGKKVFEKRVTQPRLTLPGSFRFTAGNYRWIVVPASGSAGNPQYAPAIIDSKFVVA